MAEPSMSFGIYVDAAATAVQDGPPPGSKSPDEHSLLNGASHRAFRQLVDLGERRRAGTFFSGTVIATKLAALISDQLEDGAVVMDPTCGMGDLLLAYAAMLPIGDSLDATLRAWGTHLAGMDQQSDLIRMTKIRLSLLARSRGQFAESIADIDSYFPLITVGDMLESKDRLGAADGFLFNPPFGQIAKQGSSIWATGQVNAAAVFLESLVVNKKGHAPVAAVLPEVLRCGSRYKRFRHQLEALNMTGTFASEGRFDAWTDVDVFTTLLLPSAHPQLWPSHSDLAVTSTIGDYFDVHVGTVVPHRHPNRGPWRRYLCAKSTPAWSESFVPSSSKRFNGTVFGPPFVVVRRTSSPSDRCRAVSSLIGGDLEVAVENHLVVLSPRHGGLDTCRRVLGILKHNATTDYLNTVIRCRHLTTGSVASIPWLDNDA